MLRNLKGRLGAESKRTSSVSGRARLNEVERSYYAPAVQEADSNLMVRVDSVPGEVWIHDLMSARIDIDTFASQLRDQLK